jgi:hypothetical protein
MVCAEPSFVGDEVVPDRFSAHVFAVARLSPTLTTSVTNPGGRAHVDCSDRKRTPEDVDLPDLIGP